MHCVFMLNSIVWMMCVILHMSAITQNGDSALMKAAYYGRTAVVVELVKAGALLDLQNTVCPYPIIHDVQEHAYSLVVYCKYLTIHVNLS